MAPQLKSFTMIRFYAGVMALAMLLPLSLSAFETIGNITHYTALYPEDEIPFKQNSFHQDYENFYVRRTLTKHRRYLRLFMANTYKEFWHRFKRLFSNRHPCDLPHHTEKLLEKIIAQEQQRLLNREYVLNLHPQEGDTFIIWGNLQGAFHSFARGIEELHRQGIIDTNLRLAPNHYLIVNGNLIGSSAFNLELFTLFATLMVKNRDRVWYVRGERAILDNWRATGLAEEIAVVSGGATDVIHKLGNLIDAFFTMLPKAIYLTAPSQTIDSHIIKITGLYQDDTTVDQAFFAQLAEHKDLGTVLFVDDPSLAQVKVPKGYQVDVVIKNNDSITNFVKTDGLTFLIPENGSTNWSVFSSPTQLNRVVNHFMYDAFVKIKIEPTFEATTVKLYNRNMESKEPFNNSQSYFLYSGLVNATDGTNHIPGKALQVAALLDLTDGRKATGFDIARGITTALIAHNNPAPGTKQWLQPLIMDKQYHQPASIATTMFFPAIADPCLHNHPSVVSYRPSFMAELKALLAYATQHEGESESFGFFYPDDEFGRALAKAGQAVLQARGASSIVMLPYNKNNLHFNEVIHNFKQTEIDNLICIATSVPMRTFIEEVGVQSLMKTTLYGLSLLNGLTFQRFAAHIGLKIICSNVVPNPTTSPIPLIVAYRACMDQRGYSYSTYSLEGFIVTSLLFDAIAHIPGKIDEAALKSYFTSLKEYDFEGLSLNYDAESDTLSKKIWISTTGHTDWELFEGRITDAAVDTSAAPATP